MQRSWSLCISRQAPVLNPRKSGRVRGFLWKTSFPTPQKKKSIGIRSGERGGHSILPRRPIHLSWNVALSSSRQIRWNTFRRHQPPTNACFSLSSRECFSVWPPSLSHQQTLLLAQEIERQRWLSGVVENCCLYCQI